jgi:adhesin/invasin
VLLAPANLASFGLTIDNLRLVVIRPVSDTVKDTTVAFNPDSSVLKLALQIPLVATAETFSLSIQLRAGSRVMFSGTSAVHVTSGVTDSSAVAADTLQYVGPGSTVARLSILPFDSVVTLAGSLRFQATAFDGNSVAVDSFFVRWSTSDTVTAPITKGGLLHAPNARGTVFVRAVTPNNVHDSAPVTFVPVPDSLNPVAGAPQSGAVTTQLPLPLRVHVLAADLLGVKGIAVSFRALSGNGDSVSHSVRSTDANGFAEDTVFLGTVTGPRRVEASISGVRPDTFVVTATAGPVSPAKSVVTVSSATVPGGTAATLTLQAKDGFGNSLTTGGATVVFSTSGGTSTGTISATTDHGDGTYTATFTGLVAGTATTIGATVNSAAVTTTLPTITVTAGAISPLTSVVTTSAATVSNVMSPNTRSMVISPESVFTWSSLSSGTVIS